MNILITGAGGKTGLAILDALARQGTPAIAFLRSDSQITKALEAGAISAIIGDLHSPNALNSAMKGIDVVYHICPNVHPEEVEIGKTLIAAAKSNNIQRIVYHSVLHPMIESMPHHWKKLRVEEMLLESDIPYTILQPCAYMQNITGLSTQWLSNGRYQVPFDPGSRFSIVDIRDVAEAAAKTITSHKYKNFIFQCCGPQDLSSVEIAGILSAHFDREIIAGKLDITAWEANATKTKMNGYAKRALTAMFEYYDKHGLVGNGRPLEWVLGRKPTSFSDLLSREFPDEPRS